ncbi:hypothetical protein UFOVP397_10 [uncultured Caudovirales phage]|uniref:Uncharacterized protein n=1 Tax=uncultured Caudovirales phage TaxID=2100421 RepID=A0A6J5LZG6_9CAUD|nr:hypothetical protein UFOVP397_10 [uncultured Caudovirales phage]
MYTNAQYYNDPLTGSVAGIRCDINGVTSFVPLDEANSDYAAIMRLVEAGELVVAEAPKGIDA